MVGKIQNQKLLAIGLVMLVLTTIWIFQNFAYPPTISLKPLRKWKAHRGLITNLVFSQDKQFLVSASWDGKVKVWKVISNEVSGEIRHSNPVRFVSLSPDGKLLATSSYDPMIRIWRFEDGALVRELKGHKDWVHAALFSPDSQFLVSASKDSTIKIWKVSNGQLVRTLTGHSKAVITLAFSPDGKLLASGSEDGTVKIWQFPDGKLMKTLVGDMLGYSVNRVAFSPEGKFLAGGCMAIKIWNIPEGQLVKTLIGHKYGLSGITFSPDGRYLISASSDGRVKVWAIENGKVVWEWKDLRAPLSDLAVNLDYALRLYRYGFSLNRLIACPDPSAVAFSPDGHLLAIGLTNGWIHLWKWMNEM